MGKEKNKIILDSEPGSRLPNRMNLVGRKQQLPALMEIYLCKMLHCHLSCVFLLTMLITIITILSCILCIQLTWLG